MLQNFDNYENENKNDYIDFTALLTHVVGYCGDLDGESEAAPLIWQGGSPISRPDRLSA